MRSSHRTSAGAEEISAIQIATDEGEPHREVVVPDLAGESIQKSLADRRWTADFAEFARSATGILLFIHPEEVFQGWSISDAVDVAGQGSVPERVQVPSPSVDWSHSHVPTQVNLVDLLQLLSAEMVGRRFRLAIVVSAWDLVEGEGLQPSEWLARDLPLLDQFVESASSRIEHRVYGISAQGGQLPEESDRLRAYSRPSERVQVVLAGRAPSHDITAPLRWVLDAEGG